MIATLIHRAGRWRLLGAGGEADVGAGAVTEGMVN
jgi:hypothetical protein